MPFLSVTAAVLLLVFLPPVGWLLLAISGIMLMLGYCVDPVCAIATASPFATPPPAQNAVYSNGFTYAAPVAG